MRLSVIGTKSGRCFWYGFAFACCATSVAGCSGESEPASQASASAAPAAAPPQAREVVGGDWPSYNRTLAGDRFSPLNEIDRGNVEQLRVVCTYTLPEVTAMQAGPCPRPVGVEGRRIIAVQGEVVGQVTVGFDACADLEPPLGAADLGRRIVGP